MDARRRAGSRVGPLVSAVLLSALLGPAILLTHEDQGLPSVQPVPSLNLKFNPRTMTLTWDCSINATAVQCVMVHPEKGLVAVKVKETDCHCSFWNYFLHGGVRFMVMGSVSHRNVTETVNYSNPGGAGTAAENVSCVIYNADFMNCTWARGPAAPGDVQYFLFIQDSKRTMERECPRYAEGSGTHVGCHLDDLSRLTPQIYVLVNGTSQRAHIQFFDTILWLNKIERYSPPPNVTVRCNASHCLIRWEPPRTRRRLSDRNFQYQLDIQTQNSARPRGDQLIEVPGDEGNHYSFLSPEPRHGHAVRMRTADVRLLQWGDWGMPVAFGSGEREAIHVHVYVLVVAGTLVGALILGCLFKRFSVMDRLFPPIPGIKNHAADQPVTWDPVTPGVGKDSNEEVLTVQEVTESTASL